MRVLIFTLLACFFVGTASAQVKFGPRLGLSSSSLNSEDLFLVSQTDSLKLRLAEAKYGVHFGAFMQYKVKKFFIQPEIVFNSSKLTYTYTDFNNAQFTDSIFTSRFQYLDMPVMLGFKLGIVRLQGGVVGHYLVGSKSEIAEIAKLNIEPTAFTYGWQAGLGFDIGSLIVDLKYEDNFANVGENITLSGKTFNFAQSPARFVASIGYKF